MSCARSAVAIALVAATGIGAAAEPQIVDRIVAVVDNRVVTRSDLNRYQALFANGGGTESDLLRSVIDERLLLVEAQKFEIPEPSAADVRAATEAIAQQLGGRDRLDAALNRVGMVPPDLTRAVQAHLRIQRLLQQRVEFFLFVAPSEVETYVDGHPGAFAGLAPAEAYDRAQQLLAKQKTEERRAAYLERLRTRADIRVNPTPPGGS